MMKLAEDLSSVSSTILNGPSQCSNIFFTKVLTESNVADNAIKHHDPSQFLRLRATLDFLYDKNSRIV